MTRKINEDKLFKQNRIEDNVYLEDSVKISDNEREEVIISINSTERILLQKRL